MDIRKDFESAATFLYRLAGIGNEFARYNKEDWPHLVNDEDFHKVYRLPPSVKWQFEDLYAKGRDCAIGMSVRLRDFNDVGQFPTLSLYVDSFEKTWAYKNEELQEFIEKIKALAASLEKTPWAVDRMIEVFQDQLKLLEAVRGTVEILKKTNLYRIEKGEAPVEKEQNINIGSINGKVNINSTDNSTNVSIESSPIFSGLRNAIGESEVESTSKNHLLLAIESMEKTQGTPAFSEKYKDFIQQAANHMALISPFLPALTSLLG